MDEGGVEGEFRVRGTVIAAGAEHKLRHHCNMAALLAYRDGPYTDLRSE